MPSFAALHKHKRARKKRTSPYQAVLDLVIDIAVVLAPLSLLPQLILVWRDGSNAGVSMYTWLFTALLTLPLILYDLSHRAYKLIVMHVLIVLISIGIVAGLLVR